MHIVCWRGSFKKSIIFNTFIQLLYYIILQAKFRFKPVESKSLYNTLIVMLLYQEHSLHIFFLLIDLHDAYLQYIFTLQFFFEMEYLFLSHWLVLCNCDILIIIQVSTTILQ